MADKEHPSHPATFTPVILTAIAEVLAEHLPAKARIFDCFAGIGTGPDRWAELGYDATGIDLEPEWADASVRVAQGDAADPASWPSGIDAVVLRRPTRGRNHP